MARRLGLGGTQETPHRGHGHCRRGDHGFPARRDGASRDHDQPRVGKPFIGKPLLDDGECVLRRRVGCGEHVVVPLPHGQYDHGRYRGPRVQRGPQPRQVGVVSTGAEPAGHGRAVLPEYRPR